MDNMNSVSSLNNYTGTSLNSLNGQTATYGSISDIPMENIDHIEYVTGGAATTVYGSDAANGVIQIFTKKGSNNKISFYAGANLGADVASSQFYHFKRTKELLLTYGFTHVTMCDRLGIIGKDYPNLNWMQQKMTEVTNLENAQGTLADALKGADIFVGVSAPNIVTAEMVASMNKDAILFAMANPVPEIMPDVAKAAGARVVGTGRSDFPNQINNVVAFPGIFKGALEGRATQITEEMKLAAAEALAGLVSDEELNDDFIMPEAFDPRVAAVVSEAVKSHI